MSERPAVRVAAAADLHLGVDSEGLLAPELEAIEERADLFLIAGDFTRHGDPAEAQVFAGELSAVSIPMVAVLGNHDYHSDQQELVTETLEQAGVVVLEGDSIIVEVGDLAVGVAGTKGFGGGFRDACGSDFGEPEMKAFVRHSKDYADGLQAHLGSLANADLRLALVHYSPIPATLEGEKAEIFPFLGSYYLEDAIDEGKADAGFHGHAHAGTELGRTRGGVPVYNVAHPVIKATYRIVEL